MKKNLDPIYRFLSENREHNKDLQERYYKSINAGHDDVKDKVVSLLYKTVNTQSRPRIDKLSEFYRFIYEDLDALTSFGSFVERISRNKNGKYADLFKGLRKKSGWGSKTSALFVKSIFQLHNGQYNPDLLLWNDAPKTIEKDDHLYLPVDSVIIEIFKKLGCNKPDFDSINRELRKHYSGEKIEVWDDLWFWGFITQKGLVTKEHSNGT